MCVGLIVRLMNREVRKGREEFLIVGFSEYKGLGSPASSLCIKLPQSL